MEFEGLGILIDLNQFRFLGVLDVSPCYMVLLASMFLHASQLNSPPLH